MPKQAEESKKVELEKEMDQVRWSIAYHEAMLRVLHRRFAALDTEWCLLDPLFFWEVKDGS